LRHLINVPLNFRLAGHDAVLSCLGFKPEKPKVTGYLEATKVRYDFFFTQEGTAHVLRFYFVIHSQDSCRPSGRLWGTPGSNPELLRNSLVSACVLNHWATTSPILSCHIPPLSYHIPSTELPHPHRFFYCLGGNVTKCGSVDTLSLLSGTYWQFLYSKSRPQWRPLPLPHR
jgi:hypothetical protein